MFKVLAAILGIVLLWCLVDSLLYLVAPAVFLLLMTRNGRYGK